MTDARASRRVVGFVGDIMASQSLAAHFNDKRSAIGLLLAECEFVVGNLETTLLGRALIPAAEAGGTLAYAPEGFAKTLRRLNIRVVSLANNHAADFGSQGSTRTRQVLRNAGISDVGWGTSLDEASEATYAGAAKFAGVVAATTTFPISSMAANAQGQFLARPGVNPLRYTTTFFLQSEQLAMLQSILMPVEIATRVDDHVCLFGKFLFRTTSEQPHYTLRPFAADLDRILQSVRDAANRCEAVIFSLHRHQGSGYDEELPDHLHVEIARKAIESGARVVVSHGPHLIRGIEFHAGGVILYGLGGFIMDRSSLPPEALTTSRDVDSTAGVPDSAGEDGPGLWDGIAAFIEVKDQLRVFVLPLDLTPQTPGSGLPRVASGERADQIIQRLVERSPSAPGIVRRPGNPSVELLPA